MSHLAHIHVCWVPTVPGPYLMMCNLSNPNKQYDLQVKCNIENKKKGSSTTWEGLSLWVPSCSTNSFPMEERSYLLSVSDLCTITFTFSCFFQILLMTNQVNSYSLWLKFWSGKTIFFLYVCQNLKAGNLLHFRKENWKRLKININF